MSQQALGMCGTSEKAWRIPVARNSSGTTTATKFTSGSSSEMCVLIPSLYLRLRSFSEQACVCVIVLQVLSSFILRCDNAAPLSPDRDGETYITSGQMPPTLAIKPHDEQWPQVRLHPPVGSKLDLIATGAVAEHARKPLSKRREGESLLVFVGR